MNRDDSMTEQRRACFERLLLQRSLTLATQSPRRQNNIEVNFSFVKKLHKSTHSNENLE
jgi:hypothetical protein